MKINQRVIFFLLLFVAFPVWAGQGWYMMKPPIILNSENPDDSKIDESAPFSKWDQIQAFDTAKDCEKTMVKLIKSQKNKKARSKSDLIKELSETESRCIATDDPRLKP